MQARLLAVTALGLLSCSSSGEPSKLAFGGGIMIYPNVDIAQVRADDGPRVVAAAVIGLSTAEVLTRRDDAWDVEALCPPTAPDCDTARCAPVALTIADVDLDAKDDLLLFDTDCGNWIVPDVASSSRTAVRWDRIVPDIGPDYTLLGQDLNSDGRDELIQANSDRVAVTAYNDEWSVSYAYPMGWPRMNHMRATQLVLPVSRRASEDQVLVLQRGTLMQAHSLQWTESELLGDPELWDQEDLEYLKPYSGFDHLTGISFEDCDVFALGIGLFESTAGPVPRELQLLKQTAGGYSAETLATIDEVEHFTVLRSPLGDRYVVVVFERRGGEAILELGELTTCGDWRTIDAFELEFDWRTIDNPPEFKEPHYPKSLGVKFASWLSHDERLIELMHYDGFVVRSFTLELEDDEWRLRSTSQVIHDRRTDLVLAE